MSLIPLPIRLATVPQEGTRSATAARTSSAPDIQPDGSWQAHDGAGAAAAEPVHGAPTSSSANAGTTHVTFASSPDLKFEAAAGPSNHQFWLKDAKIAEDLFTIHRSAKHLVEFVSTCRKELAPSRMYQRQLVLLTTSMIGSHDLSLGHRPIPVMSDGDVLFMTQLSNDIARSVGGISAVRHHGMRTKKRKVGNAEEAYFARDYSHHRHSHRRLSRGEATREDRGSGSKRTLASKGDTELSCYKCGRTETPEWRKGPDGLLCNVCGLIYAKQRRKLKGG